MARDTLLVGPWLLAAALVAVAAVGCKGGSAEMKECLGACEQAEDKTAQCTGPTADDCKKAIAEAANECRALCKEHVK